jgi:hypothetical protein
MQSGSYLYNYIVLECQTGRNAKFLLILTFKEKAPLNLEGLGAGPACEARGIKQTLEHTPHFSHVKLCDLAAIRGGSNGRIY